MSQWERINCKKLFCFTQRTTFTRTTGSYQQARELKKTMQLFNFSEAAQEAQGTHA